MKRTASFLVVAMALVMAVIVFSCSQQENAPTSTISPEGGPLLKSTKTDLVSQNFGGAVVGSVTFQPGTNLVKIIVSLTNAIGGEGAAVAQYSLGDCDFFVYALGQFDIDAHGHGRISGFAFAPPGPNLIHVRVLGASDSYYADCVSVTVK